MNARKHLFLPGVVALTAFAILVALGTWQLERRAWKTVLIETLTQRLAAAPVALPARAQWTALAPARDEFRRVAFRAEFLPGQEALVYTAGSALRRDIAGPGYWVFAPARLPDGGLVVVNRGFVPPDRQHPHTRAAGELATALEIVGALRWPEPRGWFLPRDDPRRNVWFVRDHLALAAAQGWNGVAPFFVDQEAPLPPGGLPRAGALTVQLRNDHLQYALTWYGLAAALAAMFAVWARRRASTLAG